MKPQIYLGDTLIPGTIEIAAVYKPSIETELLWTPMQDKITVGLSDFTTGHTWEGEAATYIYQRTKHGIRQIIKGFVMSTTLGTKPWRFVVKQESRPSRRANRRAHNRKMKRGF